MNVLIKGLDMPKDSCDIRIWKDGSVSRVEGYHLYLLQDVEAIEVPTLYGPLVDGKDLWTILRLITMDDQPAIIEAEEGEEDERI